MMGVFVCTFLLICLASSNAMMDPEIFQTTVLSKLKELEGKVALQNEVIDGQKSTIGLLLNALHTSDKKVDDINRQDRFLLDGNEGPVAFTASLSARFLEHVGLNQTILFDTVLTNVGNGFDNTTGVFTAPAPGIYMITCSLLDHMEGAHGTAMLHAEVVQNDQVISRVFAHATDKFRDQGSQTVFVQANQGDRFYVRSVDNKDLGLGGEMYSSFSGYLMTQL